MGNTHITFQREASISGRRADYWVILRNGHLVGCVEVKKPHQDCNGDKDKSPLEHERVLGQLYDYMRVIRSFYGTTPVWGIVTTFNEWRFCKLLDDDSCEAGMESPPRERASSLSSEASPYPTNPTPSRGPVAKGAIVASTRVLVEPGPGVEHPSRRGGGG